MSFKHVDGWSRSVGQVAEGSGALAAGGAARSAVGSLWADWRIALPATIAVASLGGVVAAWLTPRGPATSAEALGWMLGTLLLGLAAGAILGSRWSLLIAPITFVAAFELARMGTAGPTVDALHPGSMYGIIAIIVGRGVTYLLGLGTLILGSVLGVELAARLGRAGTPRLGIVGWAVVLTLGVAMLGLAWLIAQPARTAPILGADGEAPAGSITELTSIELGGHDQALMIRGRSTDDPVFLHLAGGPGGTDMGAMRADASLEQHFVVVTWDQRGTGKSYTALDPVETLTVEQMISDTIELSEYLRDRFDEEKIYLHGQSWGSTLGVLAVQRRPDLYHAFIGSGQMVSQRATDILFYEDTLAWAESIGDGSTAAALREQGPPPYADILGYELALSHEHDWNVYPEFDSDREMPFNLFVPENDLMDRVNGLRAFLDVFSVLYPQLQDIDFRLDVPRLEVPFYLVMGAHEARGRAVPAEEWYAMLEAPMKQRFVFEHSGHRPSFEEPGAFTEVMTQVLAETGRG